MSLLLPLVTSAGYLGVLLDCFHKKRILEPECNVRGMGSSHTLGANVKLAHSTLNSNRMIIIVEEIILIMLQKREKMFSHNRCEIELYMGSYGKYG